MIDGAGKLGVSLRRRAFSGCRRRWHVGEVLVVASQSAMAVPYGYAFLRIAGGSEIGWLAWGAQSMSSDGYEGVEADADDGEPNGPLRPPQ
jgi:hypothetical protein